MPWKPLKREKRKPGAQLWCSDSRLWRILDVWLVLCKPTFSTWSALRPYKQGLGLRKEAECLRVWKLSTKQFFLILFIIKTWPFYWMFNEGDRGLLDMGPKMLRCDKRTTWFSTSALGSCPQSLNQCHLSETNNYVPLWPEELLPCFIFLSSSLLAGMLLYPFRAREDASSEHVLTLTWIPTRTRSFQKC